MERIASHSHNRQTAKHEAKKNQKLNNQGKESNKSCGSSFVVLFDKVFITVSYPTEWWAETELNCRR